MPFKNLSSLGRDEVNDLFSSIDSTLLDCDGVLWVNTKIIPGAPEVLNKFNEMGKRVFYITNNIIVTREEFCVKCDKLGFKSTKDTTSYLAVCYLQAIGYNKKVYVVGTSGISRELSLLGITNFGVGSAQLHKITQFDYALQDSKIGLCLFNMTRYIRTFLP
jgi:phosphoglycolate phosphatase